MVPRRHKMIVWRLGALLGAARGVLRASWAVWQPSWALLERCRAAWDPPERAYIPPAPGARVTGEGGGLWKKNK
eukprot:2405309-Pyramimonas_sp.AAC.1